MDRLVVMRTFVAVARVSTFNGAAGALGISPSLVSRHVADLEAQVGVRLVNRTARSVSLTDAGQQYAEFADRILQEIEETDAELAERQSSAEGQLSILCPKWIGNLDLGTAIGAFVREHPRIRVRVELGSMSDRLYDFLDRGFDVAFHARDPRDSRVRVRRVTELPFVLAGSAEYLSRRGTPQRPSDLAGHELLTHANDAVWHLGDGPDAQQYKVQEPAVMTNAYLLLEQMVEQGCGIGIIPRGPAQPALDAGRIVEVLPQLPPPTRSLYAVHGPGGQTPARVRLFLDFISGWYRSRHDA
ncbi:LysR family transcriptional regulator [Microbacterium oryzae]|uniref:LysR family transcriptional regulator n=1 Tax=Microbacterium oryzae TaxID=743009 RepID=UPI0025B0DB5F|nr:LysR family transcriptional regulator [Microbacterium oryzae]MDN3310336.1 LysR family transcriptional regulator [Microbacterium oryzae]